MSSPGPLNIRPVILCGGAGTRLWPLSRADRPKQFLHLVGNQSLLQQTLDRLNGRGFAPAIIISGEDQAGLVESELRHPTAAVETVLLEPCPRNTAAAAALAAQWLHASGRDELMLLMPSDHVIGDRDAFLDAVAVGVPHAEGGAIVTFGAQPTEPNTQYGYIEAQSGAGLGKQSFPIARFHEKPDAGRAAHYLSVGGFFWNCGIFLAKASTILEEMRIHCPESLCAIVEAITQGATEGRYVRPSASAFSRAQNISIDHAIMEKTSRGVVVPVQMQWSDVGAWDAVWKLACKDAQGNVTQGDVIVLDSHNSLLRSEGRARLAVIGLEDMAVIAVDDVVLVAPLSRVAEVKDLVTKMSTARKHPSDPDPQAGGPT